MAGRQANKKLALRITDRCLPARASQSRPQPAVGSGAGWRGFAVRLRLRYPTLRFFWVWGLTALADTFSFQKPFFYQLLLSRFHCLTKLRYFIAGFLTSFLLADGTAFHCVTCPAIRPFSFCLHPCSRSMPAGAFSLTLDPLHCASGSLRRHPPRVLRCRFLCLQLFPFSFLPEFLLMAKGWFPTFILYCPGLSLFRSLRIISFHPLLSF